MKTIIAWAPASWKHNGLDADTHILLEQKAAGKSEFRLLIPRIVLSEGAVFDYNSEKHQSFLAFRITEVRCNPFKDIVTYFVDFDETDLTEEEFIDEMLTVWTEPIG